MDADIAAGITFDLFGRKVMPLFSSPLLPAHFAADFVAFWESVALPSSALERESRILILVGDVIETLGELPAEEPDAEGQALRLLRAHLWEHPADEPPLPKLAHSAQLSVARLRCAFVLDRGVDLGTYQHLTRLALAKASLQSGWGLGEAAERVGLDADHLSQEFRRVYRLPLEAYRRSVAG